MNFRKIKVNKEDWEWRVGKEFVTIRKDGKTYRPHCSEVSGIDNWQDAQYDKLATITPKMIETWIKSYGN